MSDEIGLENHVYHTHIYMTFSSATRFSTLKKYFDGAHFEMCRGTSLENRDYIYKEGKYANDKKKETNLVETHEEYGEMPMERQGHRTLPCRYANKIACFTRVYNILLILHFVINMRAYRKIVMKLGMHY